MNPILIEQTRQEIGLAIEVHRNAAICAIRLARGKTASQPLDETLKGPIVVKFTTKSRSVAAPKGKLRIEVDFRVAGEVKPPRGEKSPVKKEAIVRVECTFALDYQLREGFEPSAKQVKAFKDGNVIFNCWPYFREYLQDSIQRMGFPPLAAPFLGVQPKPIKTQKRVEQRPPEG